MKNNALPRDTGKMTVFSAHMAKNDAFVGFTMDVPVQTHQGRHRKINGFDSEPGLFYEAEIVIQILLFQCNDCCPVELAFLIPDAVERRVVDNGLLNGVGEIIAGFTDDGFFDGFPFPRLKKHPFPDGAGKTPVDWQSVSRRLKVDRSVGEVDGIEPGEAAGLDALRKFMKKGLLPTDLDKHLVAMKSWGLIRKESEQKRLCDVFITRFKKAPYVIHIQESPYNVVIAIADERLVQDARADHENLLIETATSILNEELKPNLQPGDFHISEIVREGHKITKITWTLESIIVDRKENGTLRISLVKASEIGTRHVVAETDGRFIKFEIVKYVFGPRAYLDPYIERF